MKTANLRDLLADAVDLPPAFGVEEVLGVVAEVFHVAVERITSRERTQPVALARQVAMTLAFEAGVSCTEVGRLFKRHHGTVLHARQAVYAVAQGGTQYERAQLKAVLERMATTEGKWRAV